MQNANFRNNHLFFNFDDLSKSLRISGFVIPAKAGSQYFQIFINILDSSFQRSDDFLRNYQFSI